MSNPGTSSKNPLVFNDEFLMAIKLLRLAAHHFDNTVEDWVLQQSEDVNLDDLEKREEILAMVGDFLKKYEQLG